MNADATDDEVLKRQWPGNEATAVEWEAFAVTREAYALEREAGGFPLLRQAAFAGPGPDPGPWPDPYGPEEPPLRVQLKDLRESLSELIRDVDTLLDQDDLNDEQRAALQGVRDELNTQRAVLRGAFTPDRNNPAARTKTRRPG